METLHHGGGVKGALVSLFGAAKGSANSLSNKFDDLLFLALKLIAIAVACIAVHKYSGLRAGADDLGWWMFFGLGLVAIGFEYYGAQTIIDGWFDRTFGAIALGALLCAPALAFSYSNAIGSASVQQSRAAGIQKANFRKNVNSEKAVEEAEFALKVATDARSKLKPVRSAGEARAVVDTKQAHKFWGLTDSCAKTKGPQTRAFCDDYRAAQADLKAWDDISVQDARVDTLQAKLDDARSAEANAPVEVSEVRADTLDYAAAFNTDAATAQKYQARHVALTITLFVTFAGLLSGWKRNRGRELGTWGIVNKFNRLYRWCFRKWSGEEAPQPVYNVKIEGDGKGGEALDQLSKFQRGIIEAARAHSQPHGAVA